MFPEGFLQRLKQQLGQEELEQFLAAAEHPRWVALRLNKLKTHTPPQLSQFGLTPVPWADGGYYYDPNTRPGLSPYHEAGLYYLDRSRDILPNRDRAILDALPNVIVSPHMAFYTACDVEAMVRTTVEALLAFDRGDTTPYEVL